MNTKIFTLGTIIALVGYCMSSVVAEETFDEEVTNTCAPCDDPL